MSDRQDIRRALEQRINSGSYTGITNADDIAWENTKFDPSGKDAWLRVRMSITERPPAVVGAGGAHRWQGNLFVDCFAAQNIGTGAAELLSDEILSRFDYGTQLTENSKIINIQWADSAASIQDAPWYFIPCTIRFYSYIL